MSAALLRRGLELLGVPEAPEAAPGQTKPSQAPKKRTRKAKATQAQKLRNSAKGKVPKSALAEFQKREHQGYLGVNLRFMTSARSTVSESVTRQVIYTQQGIEVELLQIHFLHHPVCPGESILCKRFKRDGTQSQMHAAARLYHQTPPAGKSPLTLAVV
uniref:Active regulator of SIRT1 n=1 Tax=Sus scrofa TaxID=9823 RepID=A0A8D1BV44_PIG